jgi:hypothetical protein
VSSRAYRAIRNTQASRPRPTVGTSASISAARLSPDDARMNSRNEAARNAYTAR